MHILGSDENVMSLLKFSLMNIKISIIAVTEIFSNASALDSFLAAMIVTFNHFKKLNVMTAAGELDIFENLEDLKKNETKTVDRRLTFTYEHKVFYHCSY